MSRIDQLLQQMIAETSQQVLPTVYSATMLAGLQELQGLTAGIEAQLAFAQQGAQAAPAGWISVSERLPDHGDSVQVWCSGAECAGVAWMRQGAWYMPEPQAIGYDTITHWQPLAGKPVDAHAVPVAQEPVALEQRATEAYALLRRVYDSGFDDDCVDAVGDWLNEHHTSPSAEQPDTVAVPRELLAGGAK